MKKHCFVVFTKPTPGQEAEYNRWYNQQHVPDVLAVPGFVSARRFASDIDGERQYLALYDLESDDPEAALADLSSRVGTDRMPMSPALDDTSISAILYTELETTPESVEGSPS